MGLVHQYCYKSLTFAIRCWNFAGGICLFGRSLHQTCSKTFSQSLVLQLTSSSKLPLYCGTKWKVATLFCTSAHSDASVCGVTVCLIIHMQWVGSLRDPRILQMEHRKDTISAAFEGSHYESDFGLSPCQEGDFDPKTRHVSCHLNQKDLNFT